MKKYIDLFLAFAKIGVMTFGGGYAMLPMLERELIDNRGWTTNEELMDYFAVAQCTPGVIAVNTATFIGYKLYGNLGGIVATLDRRSAHKFCRYPRREARFRGRPRVRVRADLQRRCEALERRDKG